MTINAEGHTADGIRVSVWSPEDEKTFREAALEPDGSFKIQVRPGVYLLEIGALWKAGDVNHYSSVGWYDGEGGAVTEREQAFEVTVDGGDVEVEVIVTDIPEPPNIVQIRATREPIPISAVYEPVAWQPLELDIEDNLSFDHHLRREEVRTSIANLQETMPELATRVASLPWVAEGVISVAEFNAFRGLIVLAELGHTATLLEYPWVVEGRNLEALEILWLYGVNFPEVLDEIMDHPTFVDGITGTEAKVIAILFNPHHKELIDTLLNQGHVVVEERTIVLPLAGETELSILRTQPGHSFTMDLLESAVREVEDFMGLPFPRRQVIVSFAEPDATAPHAAANEGQFISMEFEELPVSKEYLQSVLTHEVAHYYWRGGPQWLNEGAATFVDGLTGTDVDGLTGTEDLTATCSEFQTIAELEDYYYNDPENEAEGPTLCDYALGSALFRDLYSVLGDRTFRLSFRRLHLHRVWNVPDGCDQVLKYSRTTKCHVLEAFTAFASEDARGEVEKVVDRWFDGTAKH